jgi:hypothetical protein
MISIELRTKNCYVCRQPVADGERTVSGHFRATDCERTYISVLACWHSDKCDAGASERKEEPGGEQGCIGPFEEWMGVEVDHTSEASWLDIRKRR